MANPDYPAGHFFKANMVKPRVMEKDTKDKAEAAEWKRVCKLVDQRDRRTCQITKNLLSPNSPDAKRDLARHHLEARSLSKDRKFTATNIWTVCRAAHQLIHDRALLVLDKNGEDALDVRDIHSVKWDRSRVPHGQEPLRIRFKNAGAVSGAP